MSSRRTSRARIQSSDFGLEMAAGARSLVFFPALSTRLSTRLNRATTNYSAITTPRGCKIFSVRMASSQSATPTLTRSVALPGFAPVQIVAGPGLSEPDFRSAFRNRDLYIPLF